MSERTDQIVREYMDRVFAIGTHEALEELATALERAEQRYDELDARVRGLVTVIDRRGVFLPPAQGGKV